MDPTLDRRAFDRRLYAIAATLFTLIAAAACLAAIRLRQGRFDRVLAAGATLLVASSVIRLAAMNTPPWLAAAGRVTSFV